MVGIIGLRGRLPGKVLAGRLFRGGIAALPLFAVIGLCILMVSWRTKPRTEAIAPPAELASANVSLANQTTDSSANSVSLETTTPSPDAPKTAPLAAFQKQNILHATIRVPQ